MKHFFTYRTRLLLFFYKRTIYFLIFLYICNTKLSENLNRTPLYYVLNDMNSIKLETCTFSIDVCIKAKPAGFNYIKLCVSQNEGKTTSAYNLIKKTYEKLLIPIFPNYPINKEKT